MRKTFESPAAWQTLTAFELQAVWKLRRGPSSITSPSRKEESEKPSGSKVSRKSQHKASSSLSVSFSVTPTL